MNLPQTTLKPEASDSVNSEPLNKTSSCILDSPLLLTTLISACFLVFFHKLFQGLLPGPFEYLNIWRPWHVPGQVGNGNYILSDQSDQLLPGLAYIREQLAAGYVPFWNHRIGFGAPFFQITFLGHLFPTSALALLAPIEFYWPISAYLRILLIALPSYYLLRCYSVRPSLSLLGAISIPFSLYYATWMGATISYSFAALPFLFYALTRYCQSSMPTRIDKLLLFSSLITAGLSSFPAVTIQAGIFAALYVAILLNFKLWSKKFGSLIAYSLLAAISIAPVLFYAGEYLSEIDLGWRSNRGKWAMKETAALFTFFPQWFGGYGDTSKSGYPVNESMNYVYILFAALIPSAWAIALANFKKSKFLIFWLFVQATIFMLSHNIFGILEYSSKLPVFDTNPSYRLNTLFAIASSIVGVLCIDALLKLRTKFGLLLAAVSSLSVCATLYATDILKVPVTNEAHINFQLSIFAISLLLLLLAIKHKRRSAVFFSILTCVFFLHTKHLGSDYNSYYKPETFFPETSTIKHLQKQTEPAINKVVSVGRNLIPHTGLTRSIASIDTHWFLFGKQVAILRKLNDDYRTRTHTMDFFDPFSLTEHDALLDFMKIKSIVTFDKEVPKLDIPDKGYNVERTGNGISAIENTEFSESCLSDECTLNNLDFTFTNNGIAIGSKLKAGDIGELPVGFYPGWSPIKGSITLFRTTSDLLGFKVTEDSESAFIHFRPRYLAPLVALSVLGLSLGLYFCFRQRKVDPCLEK